MHKGKTIYFSLLLLRSFFGGQHSQSSLNLNQPKWRARLCTQISPLPQGSGDQQCPPLNLLRHLMGAFVGHRSARWGRGGLSGLLIKVSGLTLDEGGAQVTHTNWSGPWEVTSQVPVLQGHFCNVEIHLRSEGIPGSTAPWGMDMGCWQRALWLALTSYGFLRIPQVCG